MKTVSKFFFIVLLVLALVGWSFYFTKVFSCKSQIKAIQEQTRIKVTDSIQNRLSFKYDSLKRLTDRKHDSIDSLYRNKETKIIKIYNEKINFIDSISIDSNINIFSKYLSPKDSIR